MTPRGKEVADMFIAEMRRRGVLRRSTLEHGNAEFATIFEAMSGMVPRDIRALDPVRVLVSIRLCEMH
jgi:hypothetical protein